MTQAKPEPLNIQFARFTPRWAKPQRARRALVIAMYAVPFVAGALAASHQPVLLILAGLGVLFTILCFVWLIGATSARADMPNDYLDERERSERDQTYRIAFINVMGVIALGFLVSRFTPWLDNVSAPALIGLLFFVGMLMPTAVQAWVEPDPIED